MVADPDDVVKGPIYPNGPWKPPSSVQRGSVWIGDGDPSTPTWASTAEASHLTYEEAQLANMSLNTPLPRIPIQPLSYADAEPIVRAISVSGSQAVSDDDFTGWQGGLPFDYKVVSSDDTMVNLKVSTNITLTPIWTVRAIITGEEFPNRQVLIGSHRDAWTMGAGDPISGTSVLLNVAQAFGQLQKDGWRPRRTVVLCSWDAEEQGLIGSIEYGQQFANTLSSQAVAYINIDVAVSGIDQFSAAGTPQLNEFASDIFKKVKTPKGLSVYDDWVRPKRLEKLGSGSDQVVFIHNLGIPSFDLSYSSLDDRYQSVYHSNYDSFYWMSTFGDPGFEYHGVMSEVVGRLAIKLLDANIIPFNYLDYSAELRAHIEELENTAPAVEPELNFKPLHDAVQTLRESAEKTDRDIESLRERLAQLRRNETELIDRVGLTQEINLQIREEEARLQIEFEDLNDRLILAERAMLSQYGLPGRPFYKHIVFAPSASNSYAGSDFPAIADALAENNIRLARQQIGVAAQLVVAAAETLDGSY